jgi:hypothetical protein
VTSSWGRPLGTLSGHLQVGPPRREHFGEPPGWSPQGDPFRKPPHGVPQGYSSRGRPSRGSPQGDPPNGDPYIGTLSGGHLQEGPPQGAPTKRSLQRTFSGKASDHLSGIAVIEIPRGEDLRGTLSDVLRQWSPSWAPPIFDSPIGTLETTQWDSLSSTHFGGHPQWDSIGGTFHSDPNSGTSSKRPQLEQYSGILKGSPHRGHIHGASLVDPVRGHSSHIRLTPRGTPSGRPSYGERLRRN